MPIGRLRDRVTFRSPNNVADGAGGHTRGWSEEFTVWGQLMPGTGAERREAGRLQSSVPAILRVRQTANALTITTGWQAVIGGVEHQVRAIVDPDRRRRWLELTLERGIAQ